MAGDSAQSGAGCEDEAAIRWFAMRVLVDPDVLFWVQRGRSRVQVLCLGRVGALTLVASSMAHHIVRWCPGLEQQLRGSEDVVALHARAHVCQSRSAQNTG
jgi:hypothetical protein